MCLRRLLALALLLGCNSDDSVRDAAIEDAPRTDGRSMDSGSDDAGDSGAFDGGAFDAGAFDAGAFDVGPLGDRFALDFPSNVRGDDSDAPFVAVQYDDPHLNGLPFAGPDDAGVTYMWRVNLRQQTGYYVTLWWAEGDGDFTPDRQYVGGHPYPTTHDNTGTTHLWEIAAPSGGDYFETRAGFGTSHMVEYDRWHTQALRVVRNADGTITYTFYVDLPSVEPLDVLEWVGTGSGRATEPPPEPKITIGDSPWYVPYQHERLSGRLAELIIEAAARTESEILEQAEDLRGLTPPFTSAIWFFKPGWRSLDDLECEAGTGRTFHWADSGNRATLGAL